MKLKSLFGLAAIAFTAMGLATACTESTNEYHESSFYPNDPEGRVLYADQTIDSVYFVSFDSWKLTEAFQNTNPWFTASPKEAIIPANSFGHIGIAIKSTINTTSETRYGALQVVTTFSQFGTLTMPVRQTGWLEVLFPAPVFEQNAKLPTYSVNLPASGAQTRLSFRLHDTNVAGHSLTSDADWLVIPAENAQPAAGLTTLTFDVPNNTSTEARTATIILTSAGITSKITYTQAGKK